MKVKDVVNESEITSTLNTDLSDKQYRRILHDLKTKQSASTSASGAMHKVMQMWSDGDRLVGNYKTLLDDFDIII